MAVKSGSCRFGLWHVQVWWDEELVSRVMFSKKPLQGNVPAQIRRYCAGQMVDPTELDSIAREGDGTFQEIYSVVREIGYGQIKTYKDIAREAGTHPRVVGNAMAKNPTPLVIPCHRVVSVSGRGGFTPSPEIKEALLEMEEYNTRIGTKRQYNPAEKPLG